MNRDFDYRPNQAGGRTSQEYGNTRLGKEHNGFATFIVGLGVSAFWVAFGAAWAVFAFWSA